MMFQGMFQRPRQDFGMRHQSLGERPDFDMGGGMGRPFQGLQTGGNTPPMQGFQTGGNLPPMQVPSWMTGGPAQVSQSPLMAMWQRARMSGYR